MSTRALRTLGALFATLILGVVAAGPLGAQSTSPDQAIRLQQQRLQRNPYDPPEKTLDYGGYNFWLGKLNQFNGDYIQAEMVKAFLASDEYRQRFAQ